MKKLIIALVIGLFFIGCEDTITPPDEPLFFDITYEVTKTGDVEFAEINYGDMKTNVLTNYPDSLVWLNNTVSGAVLPWDITTTTCGGHPVKLSAISTGHSGSTIVLKIYKDDVVVAEKTYESNGFLWGGTLEYSIPRPQ